jgi:hypothetical protein
MKKVLKDWFTEPNNQTYCLIKVLSACGAFTFLGCAIVHVVINKIFDYQAFGLGFASILVGAGGAMYAKKDSQ